MGAFVPGESHQNQIYPLSSSTAEFASFQPVRFHETEFVKPPEGARIYAQVNTTPRVGGTPTPAGRVVANLAQITLPKIYCEQCSRELP